MSEANFFKYIEEIEAESASSLASKLRAINITYQLLKVWSDGSKHYALINANRRLPERVRQTLSQIK